MGLFDILFKKKSVPVVPEPVKPSKPAISTKTENFKVAGISFHMDDIMEKLAYENENYNLAKKQIIDDYMYDEKIFRYDFPVGKVELIPEPDNEHDKNAIKVVVDGVHIGYIKNGNCSHVKNLLSSGRVTSIDCSIYGGDFKMVYENSDDEYELECDNRPIGATVEIIYKADPE